MRLAPLGGLILARLQSVFERSGNRFA